MPRVAAIDIGSNGIRLLIAQSGQGFEVVLRDRAAVRLGQQTAAGRLDPATMDRAAKALQGFLAACKGHGVDALRAVATSAVREANDGSAFVQRVRDEIELDVEIITAAEEARLVHRAMRERFPMKDGLWAIGDLGGGSLEVALADHDTIHWSESRAMGTVRLLETEGTDRVGLTQAIDRRLDAFRLLRIAPLAKLGGLVMCGGNSRELANMLGEAAGDPAVVSRAQLASLVDAMDSLTPAQRIARWGLRPDRADVIFPAAIVYLRLAERTRQDVVHVTDWGLREGLALDLLDRA